MKFWNQYPLLRILFPLILGILISYYVPNFEIPIIIPLIIIGFLLLLMSFSKKLSVYGMRFTGGILVIILFLFLGYFLAKSHLNKENSLHYSNNKNITHLLVKIDASFSSTEKTYKTIGKVIGIKTESDSTMVASFGKLLLYFQKKDALTLKYSDEIVIDASKMSPISNLGNPHEFDYKSYLEQHQIYHQLYLIETDWLKTGKASVNILLQWSYMIRDQLIDILRSYQFSDENFAVASAILVGYDAYLDQDLRQMYAGSGAMHILCVSGLHVGIIFLILNILLKPLEQRKSTRYIKTILIVLMIWFYALITGMSPSVLRAATMFSFISLGQMINRKTSVYNSLAASAIVLIIINPFVIFHIGFQLSYSAILGILLIQPIISSWLSINNIIGKYFWDLLAVSIAAQIGTFPISLYYFHQFPNYFFITNLFVIPASFVILITGFVTLILDLTMLSGFYILSLVKDLLEFLLTALNKGIELINQLPYSVSYNLYLNIYDVWFIYAFIALLISAVLMKKRRLLIASVSVFTGLMVYNGIERSIEFNNSKETLTFYHIPGNGLLELNKGNSSLIILDSALFSKANYSRYIIENMLDRRIKNEEVLLLDSITKETSLVKLGHWNMMVIDRNTKIPAKETKVDFLWIRNNTRKKTISILEKIKPDTVIFDASNNYWLAQNWEDHCEESGIYFHNIRKKGAFEVKAP